MLDRIRRTITILLALAISCLAIAMAIASANQRAEAAHDRWLLAGLSVAVAMTVQLLPALLRKRSGWVLWPVWFMALALAGFGHASWFYTVGQDAADARQAGSVAAHAVAAERQQIEQTLRTIKARPVATVAALHARATDPDRREALALELAEARRAAGLQDRLILLSRNAPGTGAAQDVQPGTEQAQAGTWQEHGIRLVMSVVAALLVEVLGAVLWSAALSGGDDDEKPAQPAPTLVQQVVNVLAPFVSQPVQAGGQLVVDELAELRSAIARGECKLTVRSIQKYMGCGGNTAQYLRRKLLAG